MAVKLVLCESEQILKLTIFNKFQESSLECNKKFRAFFYPKTAETFLFKKHLIKSLKNHKSVRKLFPLNFQLCLSRYFLSKITKLHSITKLKIES